MRGMSGITCMNLALGTVVNVAKLGYAPAWNLSSGFVFCCVTPCGMSGDWSCVPRRVGAQMLGEMIDIPGHTERYIIWEQFEVCMDVTRVGFQELIAHSRFWRSKEICPLMKSLESCLVLIDSHHSYLCASEWSCWDMALRQEVTVSEYVLPGARMLFEAGYWQQKLAQYH